MRRSSLFFLGCALSLFIGVAPAAADNGPHVKGAGLTADTCAACHRAHTAKAPYLLKQSQETLCFTCHGSSGTGSNEDVQDGVGYSGSKRSGGVAGALRGGGFKYALIDSGSPSGAKESRVIPALSSSEERPATSSHSVNASEQTAWGNGEFSASPNYGKTIELSCGSCHDPHGNGNYRILKPVPDESGAAKPGVTIADTSAKVYTTANYWRVEDENAPAFIANIAAWCATCHTRYLASANSGHTNSGDAVYAYRHRSDQTSQGSANCIQCHVAHGSNASMGTYSGGVDNPDGTVAAGDSRLLRIDNRGVCQMCHNK